MTDEEHEIRLKKLQNEPEVSLDEGVNASAISDNQYFREKEQREWCKAHKYQLAASEYLASVAVQRVYRTASEILYRWTYEQITTRQAKVACKSLGFNIDFRQGYGAWLEADYHGEYTEICAE